MDPAVGDLITDSFELAAQRCDDLTPLVYERLFREHPAMQPLFVLDTDNSVRGSMLEWAIRAILDIAGAGDFGRNLIQSEAVNHSRNGVDPGDFPLFFQTLARTMRDVLAADWTPAIDAAWRQLLRELDAAVATAGS